jgi:hypothetical protein
MWQNFLFTFGGFELDIIAIYNNEQSSTLNSWFLLLGYLFWLIVDVTLRLMAASFIEVEKPRP